MPANYLHGVEIIEVSKGPVPVRTTKTAVIGLVGTAPIWEVGAGYQTVDQLTIVQHDVDAALYFGSDRNEYTLPQALKAIQKQGMGLVLVVNVLDPAKHKTSVTDESVTLNAAGSGHLAHPGVAAVVVKSADGNTTYILDTDYTLDAVSGTLARKGDGLPAGATVKVTYDYADPSKVTAEDIIGEVNASTGLRTGLQAFKNGRSLFGFNPKLLLAPGFSSASTVAASLVALAEELQGHAFLDAPAGTTVQQAIEGRGPAGAINFNTSSQRALLCYPMVKGVGPDGNPRLEPYSSYLAGLAAAVDVREGFWVSPSNHELKGLVGLERPISADYVDAPNTDANLLNEVGITTVFNEYGSGLRAWGNRSAAWPQETNPKNFFTVRRTADVLHESLARTCAQFLDKPLSEAIVDAIIETCNRYMRTLKQMGALVDGMCLFDPAKNPPTELALGHATFTIRFLPTPPMERITFESWVDIDLFQSFKPTSVKS